MKKEEISLKLESYKAQVKQRLGYLAEILAQITNGNLSKRIDLKSLSEDEFTDVYYGFNLMMEDLISARAELDKQNSYNLLRAEMWKLAVKESVAEQVLMESLLGLAGPAMKLCRASFYSVNKQGDAVCEIQWRGPDILDTKDLVIPAVYINRFLGNEYVTLSDKSEKEDSPINLEFLQRYEVKSFLAVPCGDLYKPLGILTFTSCKKNREWEMHEIELLIEMAKIVSVKTAQLRAERAQVELNALLEQQVRARTAELGLANRKLKEDIVKRQTIQDALAEQKEHLSVTLKSITDAVITLDNQGKILLFNKAAELMTGWSQEECEGKEFSEIVNILDEKGHAPVHDFCNKNFTSQKSTENRCFVVARDGSERIVMYHRAMLKSKNGIDIGVVIVFRDITEQERLEEELFKVRKLESVGLLAGGIAHDFNNILTAISTNLFMARMSVGDSHESYKLMSEAESAVFRATRLTKQLLTFSSGGAPVKENASIKNLIEDTVGFSLSGSNIDYQLQIAEDLYNADVDKGQIDQVLNNLIINAAQSMPEGGNVLIKADNFNMKEEGVPTRRSQRHLSLKEGNYVKIAIKDEGCGIPRKIIGKIFDPYFTTKEKGTGLGLTTAYSITQKHGGYIDAESRVGKGSTFTLYLPASSAQSETEEEKKCTALNGTGRVMIMDDDAIVRTVVEKLLKRAGFRVNGVQNGVQAMKLYKDASESGDPFSLVIMDLTIPGGMGGKDAVKKLREFDPEARVIVFSGYSNDPILANYKEYGFDGVLKKPFSTKELTCVINKVLSEEQIVEA